MKSSLLIVVFCLVSCLMSGQKQTKTVFAKNDYLLINYILHYNFDSKATKLKTKKDSLIFKKAENINMPKRVLKDFHVAKLSTTKKLVEKQLMECSEVAEDLKNELGIYFKDNKQEYEFSLDSLNKYVQDYEITVGKEDPVIFFDKPFWFTLNNRSFCLVCFYSLLDRSSGKKSLYLVEAKEGGEFDVVCEKVLVVH
jgi:hypothetical protein